MALSLLESNHQGGLDMFPPSDPQSPDTFQTGVRQNGGQWDPWSSPSAGLGPPKQPPPSSTMQRIRRSNSLTPPSNSMIYPQDPWGSNQVSFDRSRLASTGRQSSPLIQIVHLSLTER